VIDSGSGNDFLFGNQSENTLNGGTGNDYLAGDSGDILSGNGGVDVLVGREGSDNLKAAQVTIHYMRAINMALSTVQATLLPPLLAKI
jgi:hypothetical protein